MKKQSALVILVVFLLVLGTALLSYFSYEETQSPTEMAATAENSTYSADTSQNAQPQAPELNVQGRSTGKSDEKKGILPLPEAFEVYEEYADKTSALYIDIEVGTGAEPTNGDTVAMLYQGWQTNGDIFDQTSKNEDGLFVPFVFQLGAGQVIRGWDQGISGMKVGGKRRIIIPSSVGYGQSGQGQIPPNAMLIFDVELVEIQKAP